MHRLARTLYGLKSISTSCLTTIHYCFGVDMVPILQMLAVHLVPLSLNQNQINATREKLVETCCYVEAIVHPHGDAMVPF